MNTMSNSGETIAHWILNGSHIRIVTCGYEVKLPYVDHHFVAGYAPQTQAYQYLAGIRKLVR
jgi:hypothetical protein